MIGVGKVCLCATTEEGVFRDERGSCRLGMYLNGIAEPSSANEL